MKLRRRPRWNWRASSSAIASCSRLSEIVINQNLARICGITLPPLRGGEIGASANLFAQFESLYLAGGRLGQFIDEINDVRILKSLEPRLAPFLKLRFERCL